MDKTNRTELVIGKNTEKLNKAHIALLGIGGVGGFVFEMLVRLGVGKITIIDFDMFEESNLNRQILALTSTLGKNKVEVAVNRAKDINKKVEITAKNIKISAENIEEVLNEKYDYVIDAIDDVKAKVAVILFCSKTNTPIITSMGTGNRYKMPHFEVADIFKTSNDGLARKIRSELRKCGFQGKVNAVYTKDTPEKTEALGSVVYYPLMCAGVIVSVVVNKLIETKENCK